MTSVSLSSHPKAFHQPTSHPLVDLPSLPQSTYSIGTRLSLADNPPSFTICIEIIGHKRLGLRRRSQVVIVKIISGIPECEGFPAAEEKAIAKIYDPTYAFEGQGRDLQACKWSMENERNAYTKLSDLQGSIIPKFYGEYVAHRPMNASLDMRSVSVLLLELVEAPSLMDYHITQKLTSDELKSLEAAATANIREIHFRDVYHGDIMSHNLLWANGKLTILDFGASAIPENEIDNNLYKSNDEADMKNVLEEFGFKVDRSLPEAVIRGFKFY
jgi:serine/threonine protein kinase